MRALFEQLQGSVMGKVLFIGALILVLLIPIGMVKGLISERMNRYIEASHEVASAWGHAQTLGGPILVIPFQFTQSAQGQAVTATDQLYVTAEELEITGTVDTEQRRRGIYRVPVYTATLHVRGRFATPMLDDGYADLEILWDEAQITLPLTDPHAVQAPIVFAVGGGTTTFSGSTARTPGLGPQLWAPHAPLGSGPMTSPQSFSFDVEVRGTNALRFLPLARETRVHLSSDWPSPSFRGAYLPQTWSTDSEGFTADWRIFDLGVGYPATFTRAAPLLASPLAAMFGAELITPIGIHEATLRATKHAVLIVGLIFAAFFLFELFATLRLHPLQYLLIGIANCVFYLLLLALAEHTAFALAYSASATAATFLIVSYSAAVLRSTRRALPVGVLLTSVYGFSYVTLLAEDYALLLGSLGLFIVLAGFMYSTRNVDWFAVRLAAGSDEQRQVPTS